MSAEAVDEIALARRRLVPYIQRVNDKFEPMPLARFVANLLECVANGSIPKLAITAPPGSGKSTIVQYFVAWYLASRPRSRALVLSATELLSSRNSKLIREIVQSDASPWPDVRVASDATAVQSWQTTSKSEVRAFGASSTITGFRCEICVCDDVQPDEMTAVTRDSLESWFRGVLTTRLEPGAPVVLINTRWNTDDLIARVQSGEDASEWRVVNIEAINESADDPLGREIGESHWPTKWPVEELERRKRSVGTVHWDTQYQGHPRPEGGRIFEQKWFGTYERVPSPPSLGNPFHYDMVVSPTDLLRAKPDEFMTLTAVDAAGKETSTGSYSAFCTLLGCKNEIYVCEVERGRWSFDEMRERFAAHVNRWGTDVTAIEDAAMGSRLIGWLEGNGYRVVRCDPLGKSKEERAWPVALACETQRRVLLPLRASWKDAFVSELLDFPAGRNTDMGDAFVWAMSNIIRLQRDRRETAALYERYGDGAWFTR